VSLGDRINRKLATSDLQRYVGESVTCVQLKNALNKDFRSMGVRTELVSDPEMLVSPGPKKQFMISGSFNPSRKHRPITINIHVAPTRKKIVFGRKGMNRLFFLVSQTIQHEAIHRRQERTRPNSSLSSVAITTNKRMSIHRANDISYFSAADELESHAHDIAMEIRYFYPHLSMKSANKKINSLSRLTSFRAYCRAFRGIKWTQIRSVLLQEVWRIFPDIVTPIKV
jgi:hypothetical protein